MENKKIGFAVTGSFCTIKKVLPIMESLAKKNEVIPIFSYSVARTDTRFISANDYKNAVLSITEKMPIETVKDAEPLGPKDKLDILIVAPITGNSISKFANAIIDTPVIMAMKATLRNNIPVVLAVSTNDGLSNCAKNIGQLLNLKNIYFVPFRQDDCINKPTSLVADFDKIEETAELAYLGKQIQPILL